MLPAWIALAAATREPKSQWLSAVEVYLGLMLQPEAGLGGSPPAAVGLASIVWLCPLWEGKGKAQRAYHLFQPCLEAAQVTSSRTPIGESQSHGPSLPAGSLGNVPRKRKWSSERTARSPSRLLQQMKCKAVCMCVCTLMCMCTRLVWSLSMFRPVVPATYYPFLRCLLRTYYVLIIKPNLGYRITWACL